MIRQFTIIPALLGIATLTVLSVTACATRDDETFMLSNEESKKSLSSKDITSYDLPKYDEVDNIAVMVESDGEIKSFWYESKSNSITYDDHVNSGQEWTDRIYNRYISWADKNLGIIKSTDCYQYLEEKYHNICLYMFSSDETYEVIVFDRTSMTYEPPNFDKNSLIISTPMIVVHGYNSVPFSHSTAYDNNWWAWEWWNSQDLNVQSNLDSTQQDLNNMVDSYDYEYVGQVTKEICFNPNKPDNDNLIFWSMVFQLCSVGLYEPRVVSEPHYDIDNITIYGFINKEYKNNPNF